MELQKEAVTINNKVLVKLIVPEIDKSFDVYLPINKKVGNIINLLNKSLAEISNNQIILSNNNKIYNVRTKELYQSDILLSNTNIRNGTNLVIISS